MRYFTIDQFKPTEEYEIAPLLLADKFQCFCPSPHPLFFYNRSMTPVSISSFDNTRRANSSEIDQVLVDEVVVQPFSKVTLDPESIVAHNSVTIQLLPEFVAWNIDLSNTLHDEAIIFGVECAYISAKQVHWARDFKQIHELALKECKVTPKPREKMVNKPVDWREMTEVGVE